MVVASVSSPEPEPQVNISKVDPEFQPEPELEPKRATIRGRHATISAGGAAAVTAAAAAATSYSYRGGNKWDCIALSEDSATVARNSVLLIPDLLTPTECAQLIADVEQRHALERDNVKRRARRRLHIAQLSESSATLWERTLRERLLPFISEELPAVEDYIWARSESLPVEPRSNLAPLGRNRAALERLSANYGSLATVPLRFSRQEPAINRYARGGYFAPHRDKHALTVNILLGSAATAFEGGGTVRKTPLF